MEDLDRWEFDKACKCGKQGQEPHTCPYAVDIHDDSETTCNCCRNCSHECAMDI